MWTFNIIFLTLATNIFANKYFESGGEFKVTDGTVKGQLTVTNISSAINDDFLCEIVGNAEVEQEKIVFQTRNTAAKNLNYHYIKVKPEYNNCLNFGTLVSGDVHISFATTPQAVRLEALLGVNNKRESYFRIGKTTTQKIPTTDIFNDGQFRRYWLSWNNNEIKFGKMGDNTPIVSYPMTERFPINYIGFRAFSLGIRTLTTWLLEEPFTCPHGNSLPMHSNTFKVVCNPLMTLERSYSEGMDTGF